MLFAFLFLSFFFGYAQDSIPAKVSVLEKNNIQFQHFFFNAITQKSIKNYQKAIYNLEEANTLIPNNTAVLFEFSKNYYLLNKTFEAIEFANKALKENPENIWILKHLVTIYKKDNNFSDAIAIQQKIIRNHPKEKQQLVYLHLQNNNTKAAINTLSELEKEKLLTPRLRRIKTKLTTVKKSITPSNKEINTSIKKPNLKEEFKSNSSFTTLQKLLIKLETANNSDLLKYSQKGIELFPAQPLVYLMNGIAHNNNKEYKKGLESLQNGIDFVIDNAAMEAKFYIQMAKAYNGLGKNKEAQKYKMKATKLK